MMKLPTGSMLCEKNFNPGTVGSMYSIKNVLLFLNIISFLYANMIVKEGIKELYIVELIKKSATKQNEMYFSSF